MQCMIRCAVLLLFLSPLLLNAQSRDFRTERLILDDNNGNALIIQTPAGPITGGVLTVPDPGGFGQFLISNPAGGTQSVSGDLLPGADDTYDLGSLAARWQDLFTAGDLSTGGQVQFVETGGGTDYVGFQAPAAVTANQIWTLPAADGAGGEVLSTDGAGLLSWITNSATVSSNSTLLGDGSAGDLLRINLANTNTWTGAQTFGQIAVSSNASFDADATLGDSPTDQITFNGTLAGATPITFEGATSDVNETSFAITDPTADRTITFPDASGTVALTSELAVSTDATLTGDGEATNLGIDLTNSNAWTGEQSITTTSNATSTLALSNTGATGIGLEVTDGRVLLSYGNGTATTIPSDVAVWNVDDNTVALTGITVALPATATNGQILYVYYSDADTGSVGGTTANTGDAFIWVYTGGGWQLFSVN